MGTVYRRQVTFSHDRQSSARHDRRATGVGAKTRSVFERDNIVSSGDLRDAARRLDTYASAV
jgi:hypothetical protein